MQSTLELKLGIRKMYKNDEYTAKNLGIYIISTPWKKCDTDFSHVSLTAVWSKMTANPTKFPLHFHRIPWNLHGKYMSFWSDFMSHIHVIFLSFWWHSDMNFFLRNFKKKSLTSRFEPWTFDLWPGILTTTSLWHIWKRRE